MLTFSSKLMSLVAIWFAMRPMYLTESARFFRIYSVGPQHQSRVWGISNFLLTGGCPEMKLPVAPQGTISAMIPADKSTLHSHKLCEGHQVFSAVTKPGALEQEKRPYVPRGSADYFMLSAVLRAAWRKQEQWRIDL